MRATPFAWLLTLSLGLAVVLVDPMREFMSQDDGWAYARSVQHLLATGQYHLDTWSAANSPVQIYLAAGLARVFGYSLAILRLPTLLLLVAGILAFVALLRELKVAPAAAVELTRFRGNLTVNQEGVRNVLDQATLSGGVSPTDRRARRRREVAGGTRS